MNTARPWLDSASSIETRCAGLLAVMTPAEKIGQLLQFPFSCSAGLTTDERTRVATGRLGSAILAESAWAGGGTAIPLQADALNALQRIAVEESRLGIPLLFGRDVIHGHATVMPIPLAQAATFDPDLIETGAACVAREARAQGVHWSFAPMIDLCRDPRWGRIIEGYGEDPVLIARCGEAVVRGFQGDSPAAPDRMLACAKHFCGYGGSEGGRDYDATEWTDNTLRNMVLPPFSALVKAGVASVMTSFNDLGGIPMSAHRTLIDGWLKREQGFRGLVVSDWGAITDLLESGVAADRLHAAELGFNAGIDMEMIADLYEDAIPALIAADRVDVARLDDAVSRVLRTKFRAGLFEQPYIDPELAPRVLRRSDHLETARRLAEQSMVLLTNRDSLLPLDATTRAGQRIAVIGPFAEARKPHLGAWCLDGRAADAKTIVDELRRLAPALDLRTADNTLTDDMLAVAGIADLVIVCVGESSIRTGEAHSISQLRLPPGQEELIDSLGALGKPLVVVQCSGRPLPSPAAQRHAGAWLLAWHGGSESGEAIARVLLGLASPGGRLPMTMPRTTGQIPIYYNHKRPGKLRQSPHYRAYQDSHDTPLFAFGHGLGYSSFSFSKTTAVMRRGLPDPEIEVSVSVTNTGLRAESTVAQCYVRDLVAETSRPVRELKAFSRVMLAPGESKPVKFTLRAEELGYHGSDGTFRVDAGEFCVVIGADSNAPLETSFLLA